MFVVLVVALGCSRGPARSPERPEPSGVSVSPVSPERADPEPRATEANDVPAAPWSVSYHDGSGNAFSFEQSSADADPSYRYSPVTPERSSTGMYSGGEPTAGALDREQTVGLWQRLRQLETQTSIHTDSRDKGTGSFVLVTRAGERSFIVQRGDELIAFDEFLAPLRAAKADAQVPQALSVPLTTLQLPAVPPQSASVQQ
jgi:hypothetical protein